MEIEEYTSELGDISFPNGFEKKLKKQSIESQTEHFRITEFSSIAKIPYGKLTDEELEEYCYRLDEYENVKGLIVRDGVIVGVRLNDGILLPNERLISFKDNGHSSLYLICV